MAAAALAVAPAAVAQAAPGLVGGFAAVQRAAGAPIGVAIAPGGGRAAIVLGDDGGGSAWSTIKVPIAVAAEQRFGSSLSADMSAAIVHSDNAAAERLWAALGTGSRAAAAVQRVIRAGGDGATVVDAENGWGLTPWTNANEATFAAHLACIRGAGPVMALMRGVDGTQRWGAATLPGAAVKGGWSPSGGRYVVRQMAVISTPTGQAGVSMSTVAPTFTAGTRVLDRVGAWLRANQAQLPGGHC
ncbi:hypothetical protein [Tsukamurella soli]|uniref:Beta-lactamase class A n=1 Tax=Tsukamurella soli TaxID=644556 RepID=A0ABP8K661_9ACTN